MADYGSWTYEDLVGELDSLSELILLYDRMTAEQEAGFRHGSAEGGRILPEDFRPELIVEDGKRQVEIIRECLKRVSVPKLVEDTGIDEDALLGFLAYTDTPSAN